MKLLVTTNGRLYKNQLGEYYTPIVYGYSFFKRYLDVFESIRLVAHVEKTEKPIEKMLRVDGPGIEVFEVPFPHGKIDYILKYRKIHKRIKESTHGCDASVLRIPDQLAFQLLPIIKTNNIPVGLEVTSNSWDFFEKGAIHSKLRPFLRLLWDFQQKSACKKADATSYVTKSAIQKRYPPLSSSYTYSTFCSDVDIRPFISQPRDYGDKPLKKLTIIHVSGSIAGDAKGHGELLKATCILKNRGIDVECILVGNGTLEKYNQKLIDDNNLNVKICGVQPANSIKVLMENADIFVFPSYREGLPRVLIEAMSAGLPCIASNVGGIKELLPEEVLFPPHNEKIVANMLLDLISNPCKLTKMSIDNTIKSKEYMPDKMENQRRQFYNYLRKKAM